MDKGAGDGADSAEDSGSSQSYPSTLPGIPKVIFLMLCPFLTWNSMLAFVILAMYHWA